MQQKKYDWTALKLEFFESDIDEVQEFLRVKFGERLAKSSMKNNCNWRRQEKQARKEKIVEKALAKKQNELAKKLEISVDELLQAKRTVIDLLQVKLKQSLQKMNDWWSITMRDLETIWRMTKTELWEPTVVSKNENDTQLHWDWPLVQIVRAEFNENKKTDE